MLFLFMLRQDPPHLASPCIPTCRGRRVFFKNLSTVQLRVVTLL